MMEVGGWTTTRTISKTKEQSKRRLMFTLKECLLVVIYKCSLFFLFLLLMAKINLMVRKAFGGNTLNSIVSALSATIRFAAFVIWCAAFTAYTFGKMYYYSAIKDYNTLKFFMNSNWFQFTKHLLQHILLLIHYRAGTPFRANGNTYVFCKVASLCIQNGYLLLLSLYKDFRREKIVQKKNVNRKGEDERKSSNHVNVLKLLPEDHYYS